MSNNTPILFTGGSGLLALNWAIAVRDRYAITLGLNRRKVLLHGVETRHISLVSVDEILYTFEKVQPQLVIHTAGLTNVEECEANPDLARHVNIVLAENVAKACAGSGIPLVYISTDHLFSGEIPLVTETEHVAPKNIYAHTKAEAELRVIDAYPQTLVVRTNFYGWGPAYRRSFSDMIIDAFRCGKELNMFHDVFYTPILIDALVSAVHELVNRNTNGIFHVVGDERISKYQFAMHVADVFGFDKTLIHKNSIKKSGLSAIRPLDMSLSNLRTVNYLGHPLGGVVQGLYQLQEQEHQGRANELLEVITSV